MPDKVRVMVTGVGGGGHGAQILKALRMSTLPCEIVGTDISVRSNGFAHVDHAYTVPSASDPLYIERILELCKRHATQVLFHGSEPELRVMSAHRGLIRAHGILLPINDASVIDACMDKNKTMQFLSANDFCFPRSVVIDSMAEVDAIDFFPVVLKPFVGSGGSANVFIAQNRTELRLLSEYMLNLHDQFMIQEYVGTPEHEYTVGVLHSLDGALLGSIALKRSLDSALSRRHQVPNTTDQQQWGPKLVISSGVSQGEIGTFPEVTEFCEDVATKLGSAGPLNIQCRLVGDKVYIFEINPRYSGTTSLRAMAGFNEPEMMIRRHLLNEDIHRVATIRGGYLARGLGEEWVDPSLAADASRQVKDAANDEGESHVVVNPAVTSLLDASQTELGDNDWKFLGRVYRQPPDTYTNRLKAIGFTDRHHVLDAGCGFGQWSMALAELNQQVSGIDPAADRIDIARNIAAALGHTHTTFEQSGLEALPFADNTFDAIFCYGVVFLTDVEQSLREFHRTLSPGGTLYVNANGLGWYVHLWLNSPNKASDHDPRETVVGAFDNSLRLKTGRNKGSGHVILEKEELGDSLRNIGFEHIQLASEGGINVTTNTAHPVEGKPFFKGEYQRLTGVFEALAHVPAARAEDCHGETGET